MRNYVISIPGGEIVRTVTCETEQASAQAQPGELMVDGIGGASGATHYVGSGQILAYTAEQTIRKAQRLNAVGAWSNATMQWSDDRTLGQRKADKWAEIKLARAAGIDAPMATPFGTFDCAGTAFTSITAAAQMASALMASGQSIAIDFTLADNSTVTLTPANMVSVGLLLGAKVQAIYAIARTLRTQTDAANSAAQLDALKWP